MNRQTRTVFNPNTNEYEVALYINNVRDYQATYYTDDKDDAEQTALQMRKAVIQEDFCKTESKKANQSKETQIHEYPIYSETDELIGFLKLDQELPEWLMISNKAYRLMSKQTRIAD